ncbi:Ropporin-1-like protein [Hondaea fermentalgiana]|uniref:Ropporin-1-like protein n=1 Tax=Hondaea fermentalgiana TaxID=2315210 RepID=A0A2R5G968_9STRA|nr:Ropporin-1-like protein [Hondaea fermentalgiana]|eukprot:GBG27587.1 Ropporin-1-like protein [Hondaea fermentalgiana]
MDTRIFQAEQIVIRPEMAGILKEWSKAIIRQQPSNIADIHRISYEHFAKKVDDREDNAANSDIVRNS